jgi:predicted acetyltransferase
MSQHNKPPARSTAKPPPGKTLPAPDKCRVRPSTLRGYTDCLVANSAKCPHALNYHCGVLCLHPNSEQWVDAPSGKGTHPADKTKQPPALTYRPAKLADSALLGRLNYQLIHDLNLPHHLSALQLGKRMRTWLTADHQAILFELNGAVVAYAVYRESAQEIYLRQFLVVRRHRRRGLARRAIGLLRSQIWAQTKKLTVEVLVANVRALEFWRKVGYTDHSLKLEIPALSAKSTKGRRTKSTL